MIDANGSIMPDGNMATPPPSNKRSTPDAGLTFGARFAGHLRDYTNQQVDDGHLTTVQASLNYAMATFCQDHDCTPADVATSTRNWFNFGNITVIFDSSDGGYWTTLDDALRVSGMTVDDILGMFDEDLSDNNPQVGVLLWQDDDWGNRKALKLVEHGFIMRAMLRGPWRREFMDNTMGLFRHAVLNSGLADVLGPVAVVRDGQITGETMSFADVITGCDPLPTVEEAREQAFRGPAGAL